VPPPVLGASGPAPGLPAAVPRAGSPGTPLASAPDGETLEQAWAAALKADQQLQARQWEISSAERSLRASQAERWPTAKVDGSYTVRSDEPAFRFRFPAIPVPTDTFPFAQRENFTLGASANLPLYTGGRIQHGVAAAENELTTAALDRDVAEADLKMRVAEHFVTVLRAQRDLGVAQSTLRSLQAHVRDVELLFQHQQVPRNDLLAARVAESNAHQDAIRAENRLDIGRAAYNRQLGRRLDSPVRLAERSPGLPETDLGTLTAWALRNRDEIARLTVRAEALRHRAAAARATSRPQVQLRGEYTYEENRFLEPEGIAAAGVGVEWKLFDAGRDRHQAAALSQQAEALLRTRADLESRIALEVRRAWLDVGETRRRVEVTRQAVQQAEENLRVARHRYTLGAGTNTEVLDAEALRSETYRNHHAATYDLLLSVLRLRRATGDL